MPTGWTLGSAVVVAVRLLILILEIVVWQTRRTTANRGPQKCREPVLSRAWRCSEPKIIVDLQSLTLMMDWQ